MMVSDIGKRKKVTKSHIVPNGYLNTEIKATFLSPAAERVTCGIFEVLICVFYT